VTYRTRAEEMEGKVYTVIKVAQKWFRRRYDFSLYLMVANDKLRSMIGNAFQSDGNL